MSTNAYLGKRDDGLVRVYKNGEPFNPERSRAVRNHSPTGFEWGYGGSGPAQLALAILLEETSPDEAERRHQQFKRDVIGRLPLKGWDLTTDLVQGWLERDRDAHPLKEFEEYCAE